MEFGDLSSLPKYGAGAQRSSLPIIPPSASEIPFSESVDHEGDRLSDDQHARQAKVKPFAPFNL